MADELGPPVFPAGTPFNVRADLHGHSNENSEDLDGVPGRSAFDPCDSGLPWPTAPYGSFIPRAARPCDTGVAQVMRVVRRQGKSCQKFG